LLVCTLKDTKGISYSFERTNHQNPEWNNKDWIKRSNDWWFQVIARRLDRPNPDESHARTTRSAWTERERYNVVALVQSEYQKKSKLTSADWGKITTEHNKRFVGQMVRTGERYAIIAPEDRKVLKRKQKEFVSKDAEIKARTATAVQTMYKKWQTPSREDDDVEMDEGDIETSEGEAAGEVINPGFISEGDEEPVLKPDLKRKRDDDEDDEDFGGIGGFGGRTTRGLVHAN
jgi:hypothetical protein